MFPNPPSYLLQSCRTNLNEFGTVYDVGFKHFLLCREMGDFPHLKFMFLFNL